jgi:hypothetical protein
MIQVERNANPIQTRDGSGFDRLVATIVSSRVLIEVWIARLGCHGDAADAIYNFSKRPSGPP